MSTQPANAAELAQVAPRNIQEASIAPREGPMLSLPFDQYGRMIIAQNIMLALYGEIARQAALPNGQPFSLEVLDVGGYPGVLRSFLAGGAYSLTVLDVAPDDGSIPGYVQGSGLELPFGDASFDVVTSLDTLEHIPQPNRQRFLAEVMRVARYGVLLINPVQSVQADIAEETLDEYIRWVLDAQQEQLAEHRQFGLPDAEATAEAFRASGWHTADFPTANIYNWLLMMVAKHFLISLRDDRASAFERTLDRFYNLSFLEADRTEPAYRRVLVAVKPGMEAALRRVEEMYPPVAASQADATERLQLAQVLMEMLNLKLSNHESKLLREQMERRDKHIAAMETRIALQDRDIDRLNAESRSQAQTESELRRRVAELEAQGTALRDSYSQEHARHVGYIRQLEDEQAAKNEHILYLENLLAGIGSGRVMRLTRALSRFLGRK